MKRREPMKGERFRKAFTAVVASANDETRTIEHVITARVVDRDGDVIEPRGARLDNYQKNPVVLFGHDSWSFPIARSLEQVVGDQDVRSLTQFAGLEQAHPQAETAYRLVRDGFLPAVSVGFMPITWSEDKALPDQDGWWFKEWELYEYSVVAIPSNPAALARMAKAYGLPSGATDRDLADALRKDRRIYWDIAASGSLAPREAAPAAAPADERLVQLEQATCELKTTVDRLRVRGAVLDAVREFTGAR